MFESYEIVLSWSYNIGLLGGVCGFKIGWVIGKQYLVLQQSSSFRTWKRLMFFLHPDEEKQK